MNTDIATERLSQHFGRLRRCGRGWTALCPAHQDRAPSLSIAIGDNGKLLLHCHAGCTFREILEAAGVCADDIGGLSSPPQQSSDERRAYARRIWEETRPLAGTVAETYLRRRGMRIAASSLRFHPHLVSSDIRQVRFPALVAGIQGPDGRFAGIQATWLAADGSDKAPFITPRKIFGHRVGCAVRLAGATDTLCLTEGIETGLSVMQATGFPTWVTLGANGMKAIELPSTIREIIIAADADAAGMDAAGYARLRFLREGRRMRIVLPPAGCSDFNEVTT
jgi:putative DNA primase/helicase